MGSSIPKIDEIYVHEDQDNQENEVESMVTTSSVLSSSVFKVSCYITSG